jgi:hypothetical protein
VHSGVAVRLLEGSRNQPGSIIGDVIAEAIAGFDASKQQPPSGWVSVAFEDRLQIGIPLRPLDRAFSGGSSSTRVATFAPV